MAWTCGGFEPGETVELREPGATVFTDREASDLRPVTDTEVADAIGSVTFAGVDVSTSSPLGTGVTATGVTSMRRVLTRVSATTTVAAAPQRRSRHKPQREPLRAT